MATPGRRRPSRRGLLVLSFLAVFVVTAATFGVTVAGHVAVMQADAIEATVVGVTYRPGPPADLLLDLRLDNPTPRAVRVVSVQDVVLEREGERLLRSTTPTVAPLPLRVPAGGTGRATVSIDPRPAGPEVRSAVRAGALDVRGVFGGRIGDVAVQVQLRGVRAA